MSQPEPDFGAPQGATCAEHRDRMAFFTCPRCGKHACLQCFHAPIGRCVKCVERDPAEASPPLPFEAGDGTALGRYFRTFGTAFYPWRSAPAFARPGLKPAVAFFALSSLPLMLVLGIIPHTRTLNFGAGTIALVGTPTQAEIVLDVARAIAVQLAVSLVELACLVLPFASLVGAYAAPRKEAAVRYVLYRFWLAQLAILVGYLAIWTLEAPVEGVPLPDASVAVLLTSDFAKLLLRVLFLIGMNATARIACGLSTWVSLLVVIPPLILEHYGVSLSMLLVDKVLPALPEALGGG